MSPKLNAKFLQFSHHFKAHTLPFSVIFHCWSQNFVHTYATWNTDSMIFHKKS